VNNYLSLFRRAFIKWWTSRALTCFTDDLVELSLITAFER